jgi:4-amino-4-deoxy-L-arabinose transferase-like glycosyltransferase
MTRTTKAVAAAAAVAGLALRLYVLSSSLRATDSDEAVLGLIAARAGRGTVDVMFWGQAYGGTIEALVAAPFFKVFGPSVMVERLLLLVIAAVAAILTWRVGRRLVGEPAATIGAAVFWTMSCFFTWWSTKLNIYYGALCLALAVVLLLLRLRDEDDRTLPRWWPVAFGLAAGAAIWSNPQTAFLLVPAGIVHAKTMLTNVKKVATAIPFAVVGAAPWLVYSVRNHWSTLHVPGVDVYLPYTERVQLFFRQLPIAVGARQPVTGQWIVPGTVFAAIAAIATVALAVQAARNVRGTRVIAVVVVGYALLYGLSPQGGQPGASVQPRYLLFVLPVLALAIGALIQRPKALGALAVAATVACTAVGLRAMDTNHTTLMSGGPGVNVPSDFGDLTTLLEQRHIRHAYSFYWVAYRTTFETEERTIVDPAHWHVSRYKPYADEVRMAKEPAAVIVLNDTPQLDAMRRLFEGKQIAYQVHQRGVWAVVEPEQKVDREEVAAAFRSVGVLA